MKAPRLLFWDLEVSHNLLAKFDLREEWTSHQNIILERFIICGAWKWLGDKKPQAVAITKPHDDKAVVTTLRGVLAEADVIVAHNGDKFDFRWLNGRLLFHGLPPLPPIPSIDTLKVARRVFMLNSNRLDYLGKYLGIGGKTTTPPNLWIDVLMGDKKAVKVMVDYNKDDVELLEAVYLKLLPFIPDHFNRGLVTDGNGCPRCGSDKVQRRGVHKAMTRTYQRYQCSACAGWFRSLKADSKRVPRRAL